MYNLKHLWIAYTWQPVGNIIYSVNILFLSLCKVCQHAVHQALPREYIQTLNWLHECKPCGEYKKENPLFRQIQQNRESALLWNNNYWLEQMGSHLNTWMVIWLTQKGGWMNYIILYLFSMYNLLNFSHIGCNLS